MVMFATMVMHWPPAKIMTVEDGRVTIHQGSVNCDSTRISISMVVLPWESQDILPLPVRLLRGISFRSLILWRKRWSIDLENPRYRARSSGSWNRIRWRLTYFRRHRDSGSQGH